MKKDRKEVRQLKELRNRAERLLRARAGDIQDIPGDDIQKLVHELQVQHIELEMQNEQLRKAQVELEESRNRYYDLYDFAPIGYFTFDKKGLTLEVNLTGAGLLGVERSYLMKMAFSRSVAPEDQELFSFHRKKVFESKSRQTCRLKLVKRDGTPFYAQLESIVVQDTKGNSNRFRTAITDITALKRAEEELKQHLEQFEKIAEARTRELKDAQEELIRKEKLALLGQLAGSVSHELRNPFGVISNAIYYLKTVLPNADETTKEYLEMISAEVRNSNRIVSGLLDISRTQEAEREKIVVSEVVNQALEKKPPPEGIKVTTTIPSGLPPVLIDPLQIRQVLVNLITNAYQAMGKGGKLTISAELLEGSTVRNPKSEIGIRISDTGCGISKENMNKLFEPLFTTRSRGIGLGLSVSKNLVEVNKGSIEVESPSTEFRAGKEGKGSMFTVSLPIEN
jgi:PAS domain S-box-containing protein